MVKEHASVSALLTTLYTDLSHKYTHKHTNLNSGRANLILRHTFTISGDDTEIARIAKWTEPLQAQAVRGFCFFCLFFF